MVIDIVQILVLKIIHIMLMIQRNIVLIIVNKLQTLNILKIRNVLMHVLDNMHILKMDLFVIIHAYIMYKIIINTVLNNVHILINIM